MLDLEIGQLATLACILEISAPKPGNVNRSAEFPDMSFEQMLCGAVAIGPAMQAAGNNSLGATVLEAVRATQQLTGTNTNLGSILLLAPLAKSFGAEVDWRAALRETLGSLSAQDTADVYEAIRLAKPGGMGTSPEHDINSAPPADLIEAMNVAAPTDLIAAQYVNGFAELFEQVVPLLHRDCSELPDLRSGIVHSQLRLMSQFPDSLIRRKRGAEVAGEAASRANEVLRNPVGSSEYLRALSDLDFWLRADGNRRNPGTTADFIAAGLFVLLCQGEIAPNPHSSLPFTKT